MKNSPTRVVKSNDFKKWRVLSFIKILHFNDYMDNFTIEVSIKQ